MEDVRTTPIYYISKILDTIESSFLIFQYGPYLAVHYTDRFLKQPNLIKNDNLKLIVAFAAFQNEIDKEQSIHEYKNHILDIMKMFDPCKYSYTIRAYGQQLLNDITGIQYEKHLLESAMLSYAPIVQYAKPFLVKPEMPSGNREPVTDTNDQSTAIQILEHTLHENIISIIKYPDFYIPGPNDPIKTFLTLQPKSGDPLFNSILYFVKVHITFQKDLSEEDQTNPQKFVDFYKSINSLSNGEVISLDNLLS